MGELEYNKTYVIVVSVCDQSVLCIDEDPAESLDRRGGCSAEDGSGDGGAGDAVFCNCELVGCQQNVFEILVNSGNFAGSP